MNCSVKFISVSDPVLAAATEKYEGEFGTFSQLPVGGIPDGGLDRFIEDFNVYVRHLFPDMMVGDNLTVYHLAMTNMELSDRIRRIRLYCTAWPGYAEYIDKSS